jgi:hypothetical protein
MFWRVTMTSSVCLDLSPPPPSPSSCISLLDIFVSTSSMSSSAPCWINSYFHKSGHFKTNQSKKAARCKACVARRVRDLYEAGKQQAEKDGVLYVVTEADIERESNVSPSSLRAVRPLMQLQFCRPNHRKLSR